MSGAFDVELPTVIMILGVMVTFVSLVGGAFGVAASDFVQMFLVVTITLVISAFALVQPAGGRFFRADRQTAGSAFSLGRIRAAGIHRAVVFGAADEHYLRAEHDGNVGQIPDGAQRLPRAENDDFPAGRHDRRPADVDDSAACRGGALQPGGMQAIFPNLGKHPEEGAFLVTAHDVLPQGMLGLLIAGIFGATLSNLDASVNQGVGILVRNFYLPVINPQVFGEETADHQQVLHRRCLASSSSAWDLDGQPAPDAAAVRSA